MPNMVFVQEGLLFSLANALWDESNIYDEDWWVELFKSNTTIVATSTKADFTLADFSGAARESWTRVDFTGVEAFTPALARTDANAYPSFACSGGAAQTVYGWIMYGVDSDKVWCGQNFSVPRVMTAGAVIDLNPFKFYMKTLD